MAREEIDLKSVKKLNNSGKPKKSYSQNSRFAKPGAGKAKTSGGKAGTNSGKKSGKPEYKKNDRADANKAKAGKSVKDVKRVDNRVPEEWLYFQKDSDSIEYVKQACEALGYDVEFWSELGVIEVNMDDQTSIDFEMMDDYDVNEATTEYVKKNQIKLSMVVTVRAENLGKIKDIMQKITEKTKGQFFVDNGKF